MAAQKTTELPRGMRRLVIRGETWGWRFGREVPIVAPDGRRFKIGLQELTGRDWDSIERGTRKRCFSTRPGQVASYIDRTLLGYTDARGFPPGVLPRNWRPSLHGGWIGLQGPRGLWQWRPHPWVIQLRSPEDVSSDARIYDVLDMDLGEWADIKAAAIVASGSTVDDEMRRAAQHGGRAAEGFLDWDGPGLPVPSEKQVLAHIERMVAGMPLGRKERVAA